MRGFTPYHFFKCTLFQLYYWRARYFPRRAIGKSGKGFTLIETIIYLGLFALVMSGIIVSAYALVETAGRNQAKAVLQEEKDFLVAKINYALAGVDPTHTITASGSSFSATKYGGQTEKLCLVGTSMKLLENSGTC